VTADRVSTHADRYARAGVDIAAAEDNVLRIAPLVRSTHGPAVLGEFGAFAGLFHLREFADPVLVASTDGVGTKALLARQLARYRLLGRDLVNLSVNDVLTTGALPLFFLDYVGVHALEPAVLDELVAGMADACRENACALLGGETAQLPELFAEHHFDLVGTIVGAVERDRLIDGSTVRPGDRVWAFPSTGLHTNGYSLARRIVSEANLDLAADLAGQTLADALLAPHPSYVAAMQGWLPQTRAIAHITGGGLPGNLPRVLPSDVSVELDWGAWPVPPIFSLLQAAGEVPFDQMLRVFNLGLGLVFVTPPDVTVHSGGAMEVGRVLPRQAERVIIRAPA
jgi:phosphoribosylformylglycinamidine cyclo-ligase